MKIPETTMNGSADVESATGKAETNILEPLQFLLAARRGVRADPTFTNANVPDDRVLVYAGESGVESSRKSSVWSRGIRLVGYAKKPWLWIFWAFYMSFLFSIVFFDSEEDGESLVSRLRIGGYAALGAATLLFGARTYAKRRMASTTPPPFDPASYQSRLVRALDRQEIQYREVVATPLEKMEEVWKKDVHIQEKFRIEGLVDVDSSVYDVAVLFWANGNINLQFGSGQAEGTPQNKSGVLLREKLDLN